MAKQQIDRRIPQRPSLSDDVYDVIIDILMSHEVEPGQQFNIEAYARQIGVSPTPVREALTRLESEGLVVRQQLRGFIATPLLNAEEADQMTEVRRLLEPWTASRAADVATESDIERLVELAHVVSPVDASLAYRQDMQRDADFHDAIWDLAGNTFIRDCLTRLHCHLHMYRLSYNEQLRDKAQVEHLEIAGAIANRDPAAASRAMLSHIDQAIDRIHHLTSPPGPG